MARTKTVDLAAAKQRQQKIILIVGAALLLGLMALQGPKLLHHGPSAADTATPSTSTGDGTTGTTTDGTTGSTTSTPTAPAAVTTPPPIIATGPAATVSGVVIRSAGAPAAGAGQLWSLSRFKVKDPFVQQVDDGTSSSSGSGSYGSAGKPGTTTATTGGTTGPTAPTGSTGSTGSVATPTISTPVAYAYATLMVNGKPQQLTLKQVFPKGQPTFVLQAVAKSFVKIGVAGGKFTGGQAVKVDRGERVTLMNTATGQRFVMKLVYTGDQPEQIAGFKAAGTTTTPTPAAPAVATP